MNHIGAAIICFILFWILKRFTRFKPDDLFMYGMLAGMCISGFADLFLVISK